MSTTPSSRTKKTGKRIPVELTRGDVFEISTYMSPNSHGLQKKSALICPNEVVEAEDPGHEELDEPMPELGPVPEEWRFLKQRQTKIVKHTNSHISPRCRGAACVFEPKRLTNGISAGQQVNVQRPKEWITCW